MTHKDQRAPARWRSQVEHVREAKKVKAEKDAAREEKRRRQEPIAFWMKRELQKVNNNEAATEIANWRMLVQMPPGVWLRTWDNFMDGMAYYTTSLMDDAAHIEVHLPRQSEVWWEIKFTVWGVVLAQKIGADYPEMMRECLSESLERVEAAHDHFMPENRRDELITILREGEVIVQDWIARYAQKEQE